MNDNIKILIATLTPIIIILVLFFSLNKKTKTETPIGTSLEVAGLANDVQEDEVKVENQENPVLSQTSGDYTVTLKTTSGDMVFDLYGSKTPNTVNNFVTLAQKNFYDNTIFHRVIKNFMIQGGDPTGTGMGGPGYKFDDEKFEGTYDRGVLAMANSGPNTNGSQFFIMHQFNDLPKNYVVFGKLTSGFEVLDSIANAPVVLNTTSGEPVPSKPVSPVKILSVVVEKK